MTCLLPGALVPLHPPARDARDDDDTDDDVPNDRVDRQLVRMGYRFLVRGCKGL